MGKAKDVQSHCVHCGERSFGATFCCGGCEAAYGLLHDAGLTRYYDLSPDGAPRPDGDQDAALPADVERALVPAADGIDAQLHIEGIRCAACVFAIEGLYDRVPGKLDIALNPATGNVRLRAETGADLTTFVKDLTTLGYRVRGQQSAGEPAGADPLLVRAGVLVAIAMNVMTFSLSAYFGLSAAEHPTIYRVFGHASWALATVSTVIGTKLFWVPAWVALKHRMASLDVPIVFGMVAAYVGSVASYLEHGLDRAYFDTLCIFIALMVLGRALSGRMIEKNRRALSEDAPLGALDVRCLCDGQVTFVKADALRAGDELLWVPGEMLPVDGRLVDGPVTVSRAWLTGESVPVEVAAGDDVPAGTQLSADRAVRVVVRGHAGQSRLAQLLEPAPRSARAAGPGWWATAYVVAVVAFAGLGFGLWTFFVDGWRGLDVAVAVLVVTCPCAFGIAGPLADQLGVLALRKKGVLVRDMSLFARCRHIVNVVLDKTGTVTVTVPDVKDPDAVRALPDEDRAVLFNMVSRSNHPKSRALLALFAPGDVPLWPDCVVTEQAGHGLRLRHDSDTGPVHAELVRDGSDLGFFRDGVKRLSIVFTEGLASGAQDEVAHLRAMGHRVVLLSGDEPARTAAVAAGLGLGPEDARGGQSPEDKAAHIEQLGAAGTMMIGDGLNDIAALTAAGCAGVPHTDRTQLPARADFVSMRKGMVPIAQVLTTAERVHRARAGVFALAGFYNVCVLALSLAGLITPLLCAVLMPVSSVVFVLLTVALFRRAAPDARGLAPILKTSGSHPAERFAP